MGLNMIRLWGGAGVTRKAFYDACDEAGILVWQEFCITGDCNGRGATPVRRATIIWQAHSKSGAACIPVSPGRTALQQAAVDTEILWHSLLRAAFLALLYRSEALSSDEWVVLQDSPVSKQSWPLDHALFIRSAADTIRRLRNHACVALWCGGNEQTPAADIDAALQAMLPRQPEQKPSGPQPLRQGTEDSSERSCTGSSPGCLDATRAYVSGSLWSGFGEGHGAFSDGPYGCQQPAAFFDPSFYRWAFNPEVGSVWFGKLRSIVRIMRLPHPFDVSVGWQQALLMQAVRLLPRRWAQLGCRYMRPCGRSFQTLQRQPCPSSG